MNDDDVRFVIDDDSDSRLESVKNSVVEYADGFIKETLDLIRENGKFNLWYCFRRKEVRLSFYASEMCSDRIDDISIELSLDMGELVENSMACPEAYEKIAESLESAAKKYRAAMSNEK